VNRREAARCGEWAQHFSNASCYQLSLFVETTDYGKLLSNTVAVYFARVLTRKIHEIVIHNWCQFAIMQSQSDALSLASIFVPITEVCTITEPYKPTEPNPCPSLYSRSRGCLSDSL